MTTLKASQTRIPPDTFNRVAYQGDRVRIERRGGKPVYLVSQEDLALLEKLEDGPQMNYLEAVSSMMNKYNQMPLFGAVLEALMEGNEDTPELVDENIGLAMIRIKSLIDCLDKL